MKKKNIKFLIPLFVTLLLLILIKSYEPEEIDWNFDFTNTGKLPYGSYIIYDILPELFPGEDIYIKELPAYNVLKNNYYTFTNYIFINSYFFADKLDTEYLLYYISEGNSVFISAFVFSKDLSDTLGIKTYEEFFNDDSTVVKFTRSQFHEKENYKFTEGRFSTYFSEYDSSISEVLGIDEDGKANFIRIPYGNGNIFLNTIPLAFTNYHILNGNTEGYIYKALSHLPNQQIFWDNYYKAGNNYQSTPLRYILSQEPLHYAYYLILISILLFIFFYGRRKQRIIPIIPPLKNTTVEFVQTVGNLYYQQKNHKNIAEKKITYFLDYLRNKYSVKVSKLDKSCLSIISEKTSISMLNLQILFGQIEQIKKSHKISEEQLVSLNNQIENFYERIK